MVVILSFLNPLRACLSSISRLALVFKTTPAPIPLPVPQPSVL
ncbi:hypothetical protein FOTG_18863 [Fusarium oxysporum f. sp. vasinfectum 25433]|uniref:Uncharacterized protein n=1 Tax=Fusarium oxysporum f. sp. vasinfectum 25433 TaxID=1089449 RepID=X0LVW7_FUSOX|nr:hypothetical protein FOTG_18863 [Fusarium oxysporum f. sp. vasinfectum 25433]